MYNSIRKILTYVSLQKQTEDFEEIHNSITQGISFKGTNIWILVCAIIIASVGLNTNSTAVIIGAMLISPLMGPINGMGYSIAIHDFGLLRQSLKNFGFAVLASIIASTIYFTITPVHTAHSELLARTSPTIYDVLIALFGGFAGIIAISSKQKGNVIPGVAIATALMPPLCTAGYGLATFQFSFFYGAFYLFTINTVCIAYASVLISQMLKFPIRDINISETKKKRINQALSIILIIIILPSIYLGYRMSQNEKFRANAEKYTRYVGIYKGNYLLNNEISANKKEINLVYGGSSLTEDDKKAIIDQANLFSLIDAKITIEQGLAIDNDMAKDRLKAQSEEERLRQQIALLNLEVTGYRQKIDSVQSQYFIGKQLLSELAPLYPQIQSCSYSDVYIYQQSDTLSREKTGIFMITSKNILSKNEQEKIKNWLMKRLNKKEVKVYFDIGK
ncbi:TIGR00341 family protein [Dysgonomonas sp. Marseille-Q5470]|uniref:TIGR00341 family protein n=1 Tax=Dysgonomonas sp. Marseille-Q5470 TaxID=3039494 RepID=UPI0024BD341A|nr:TIGR00341 family protein [Dysgonomonas sp. Marseille-Q5470]MBS5980661.1 TIGR00341 family protein [Dysgonomonas mossii]